MRPGQLVISDHYSIHADSKICELIEAKACKLLVLPTYLPDLAPIKNAFSKIEALLRRAQATGTTHETLSHAIKHACNTIALQDVLAGSSSVVTPINTCGNCYTYQMRINQLKLMYGAPEDVFGYLLFVLEPPHKLFVDALSRVTPEVGDILLETVATEYRTVQALPTSLTYMCEILRFSHLRTGKEEYEALFSALQSWLRKVNLLGVQDKNKAWLCCCGLYSLGVHFDHWKAPTQNILTHSVGGQRAVTVKLCPDDSVGFWLNGHNPYARRGSVINKYHKGYKAALIEAFEWYVDEVFMAAADCDSENASSPSSAEHYDWLALHQVRRWSYPRIAEWASTSDRIVDAPQVGAQVRKNAVVLDFQLR